MHSHARADRRHALVLDSERRTGDHLGRLRAWIQVTGFSVNFAFAVDHLTAIMLAVVTGVGFLIHLYSAGYMAHEDGFWRFFAYLNLFMFFMSVLVLSDSFLLLFVGWEGVGLASYLLIGFYFTKTSAANAGKKAFIVNRVGDFGFLLAMFLLIQHFGSLNFSTVFSAISASSTQGGFLTAIALLLVVGAAGKSAQIPLYVWLPDAMEGPTPVSALIHAATMVTAGIYMVCRCPHALRPQPLRPGRGCDHRRTDRHLCRLHRHGAERHQARAGLLDRLAAWLHVPACGVGAYSAAIFHVMTHAFFKALLFLAAGSVIHALSGEQDMRLMGGLWKKIPVTFWTDADGRHRHLGHPPFAGFVSKDEILYRVFTSDNPIHMLLWLVGVVTAGMTSFYMFRLLFKTFFGAQRFEEHASAGHGHHDDAHAGHGHGVHESPWIMLFPLCVLALLSVVGGMFGLAQVSRRFERDRALPRPCLR